MLTALLPRQLRRLGSELSWAIRIGRGTCPGLLLSYALNAAMLMMVPAGIALSVRGLVNSVAEALDGVPLAATAAWPWLPVGIPYLLFQWRLSRRQFDELDQRAEQERWLGYYSALPRDVEQAAEIKLLGLGPELVRRWQRIMDAFAHLRADHQRAELIGGVAFVVCSVAAIYLAMGHAVGAIVRGGLSIGDLAIFGSAAAQLRGLVEHSVVLIGGLRWELLHVQRVRELLAMPN